MWTFLLKRNTPLQSFTSCDSALGNTYSSVVSQADIGVYGTICALACFSRKEIKVLLSKSSFKKFLESKSVLRDMLQDFYQCKFAKCFEAAQSMRSDLLLDIHLAPHVDKLLDKIRGQAMIEYFKPFTSVKLDSMAAAFNQSPEAIEQQLVALIADRRIDARIDRQSKVLLARHADARHATFQQALSVGNKYSRDLKSLLLRLSVTEHNFSVRSAGRDGGGGRGGADSLDADVDVEDVMAMMDA